MYFIIIHCIKFMLAQYVRPVYQFGQLIDSYAFNLGALHSDRSKFGSIAHNSEVEQSLNGPLQENTLFLFT